jgi:hypothetical protein
VELQLEASGQETSDPIFHKKASLVVTILSSDDELFGLFLGQYSCTSLSRWEERLQSGEAGALPGRERFVATRGFKLGLLRELVWRRRRLGASRQIDFLTNL